MPDLDERTIDSLPDRCANCGATLTDTEKQEALESGSSPVLCSICAAEEEPAVEASDELEPEV
jgi:hypothetical protein